jgi:hypothetical protein
MSVNNPSACDGIFIDVRSAFIAFSHVNIIDGIQGAAFYPITLTEMDGGADGKFPAVEEKGLG